MKRIGVIIGRFQTPKLTPAHGQLIKQVMSRSDELVVLVGNSPTRLTFKNPLPAEVRCDMVKDWLLCLNSIFPNLVLTVNDRKSDEHWSREVDKIIESAVDSTNNLVTLYGGRDSFIKCYTGKFNTCVIDMPGYENISATEARERVHQSDIKRLAENTVGIIYASNYRYPVSYQTVDVAVVKIENGIPQVLLGLKEGEDGLRFIGGFVDPSDQSLEEAAKREMHEECGNIQTSDFLYIGSHRVDDWRYRSEKDKILTSLFYTHYISGDPIAMDDIAALSWVSIDDHTKDIMAPEHVPLLEMLSKKFTQKEYDSGLMLHAQSMIFEATGKTSNT